MNDDQAQTLAMLFMGFILAFALATGYLLYRLATYINNSGLGGLLARIWKGKATGA